MSNVSAPSRKLALKNAVIEVSNAWLQAESHNEHARDVISHTAKEYEIDKKVVNALAKIYHKQNLNEVRSKTDELYEEYEDIFG